jgi:hypothetical protein
MNIIEMQNLDHVKVLAQLEADKLGQDQVIINSYEGKYKVFRILPENQWSGKVVATIRHAPKNKRADVLRDNGNGKSGTVKSKSKGKGGIAKVE